MNKLKKIGLTALGTAMVATSASAGTVSVSGVTGMTYDHSSGVDTGNDWSMKTTMNFTGSAELDNGFNVSYFQNLVAGAIGNYNFKVDMGDAGTYAFYGDAGNNPIAALDDKTPSANEESWAVVSGVTAAHQGQSSANSHGYSVDLMDGMNLKLHLTPSGSAAAGSTEEYAIVYTGMENLEVGIAMGDNVATAGTEIENTNMYAIYTMGSMKIGLQKNESDSSAASGDTDFQAVGISYAISDDLSVSYNISTVDHEDTSKDDQDANGVSVSYTNGSVTIAGSMHQVDNVAGTAGSDRDGSELNVTFAF